ncbi:hypothetical protein GOODEAATRI_024103, partial [Goodea atripinnis]
ALKTERSVCCFAWLFLFLELRVVDNRTEMEKEASSLSASCLSICVCQPVFVTGALGFMLASVPSVYPYFDSRHVALSACICLSAAPLCLLSMPPA